MTFEEAKILLTDMRVTKRRANAIKSRIADLESDYDSIQSALSGAGMPHGSEIVSRVEKLALRVAAERDKHIKVLEQYWALEDKLSNVIDQLDIIEQEIIIGCYMEGKSHNKIGEELGYEERTIRRKKNKAILKISDFL